MKDSKLPELHKIINKQIIANDVKRIEVTAEVIARKAKPGQFVMVMPNAKGERIPLSIVDCDPKRGIITLIFHEVGFSTKELGALSIGDSLFALLGPLGLPAVIQNTGVVACVGYGVGIAPLLSISKAYRKLESKVIGLIGAKTKRSLILEPQMRLTCHKLYVTTDDGSYERRGLVMNILPDVIKKEGVVLVCASGPIDMLESISTLTRLMKIKMIVHLNSVMVDGTGMCGSCRVKVGGKDFLACVDGPQFDGHAVDYKDLLIRTSR